MIEGFAKKYEQKQNKTSFEQNRFKRYFKK